MRLGRVLGDQVLGDDLVKRARDEARLARRRERSDAVVPEDRARRLERERAETFPGEIAVLARHLPTLFHLPPPVCNRPGILGRSHCPA